MFDFKRGAHSANHLSNLSLCLLFNGITGQSQLVKVTGLKLLPSKIAKSRAKLANLTRHLGAMKTPKRMKSVSCQGMPHWFHRVMLVSFRSMISTTVVTSQSSESSEVSQLKVLSLMIKNLKTRRQRYPM